VRSKLTICVITYNRGKRALESVRSLLSVVKSNWSILVLDNGSVEETAEYKVIQALAEDHKSLSYKKHRVNLQVNGNFRACFTYTDSQYIVIMSDEDYVNVDELESLLIDMDKVRNLGACRPSIAPHKDLVRPGNSFIYDDRTFTAGEQAFSNFTFVGNYVSGIVYNLDTIRQTRILEVFDQGLQSHKNYPHIYLDILVCSRLSVMTSSKTTVWEGKPEGTMIENGTLDVAKEHIGLYGYGERVNQFLALRDAIGKGIDLADTENEAQKVSLFINTYLRLVHKYFYLIFKVNISNYTRNAIDEDLLKLSFFYLVCSSLVSHPYIGSESTKEAVLTRVVELFQISP